MILRYADLPSTAWANGQGTTTEVLRSPAADEGQDWQWRISIATVDRPGPFSTFPGIDRTLICAGPGSFTLDVNGDTVTLAPLARIDFRGEDVVATIEVSASSLDFNVMTRRSEAEATVTQQHILGKPSTVNPSKQPAAQEPPHTTLLVVLDGSCQTESGQHLGRLDSMTVTQPLTITGSPQADVAIVELRG